MLLNQTRTMKATMIQGALPAERPRRTWLRRGAVLVGTLAALALFALLVVAPRLQSQTEELTQEAAANLRRVYVTTPEPAAGGEVTLPATLLPYQAAEMHARVGGYIKSWKADIGAHVKAGDLLAEIDTPELDQEVEQAIAQVKQGESELEQARAELDEAKAEVRLAEANVGRAKANLAFSTSQTERHSRLVISGATSREELESITRDRDARQAELDASHADLNRRRTNLATREAVIDSRAATVNSRKAAVRRLRELQGFKKLVAPFDGVIARRTAEVGTLVTAGGGPGARPLFAVVQADRLRVQAAVPQAQAGPVRTGDEAAVVVPEQPGRTFPARVARTASAVESSSRTLLVELELANTDGLLLPGSYAQVRFQTRRTDGALTVPANALLMRNQGPHVVAVGYDGSLSLRKVELGRDLGTKVEVLSGVGGRDRLVVNPSDDLRDGQRVEIANAPAAAATASVKR